MQIFFNILVTMKTNKKTKYKVWWEHVFKAFLRKAQNIDGAWQKLA